MSPKAPTVGAMNADRALALRPDYIVGSAILWYFVSRHSLPALVIPLARAITPRPNTTESPEGLVCQYKRVDVPGLLNDKIIPSPI